MATDTMAMDTMAMDTMVMVTMVTMYSTYWCADAIHRIFSLQDVSLRENSPKHRGSFQGAMCLVWRVVVMGGVDSNVCAS